MCSGVVPQQPPTRRTPRCDEPARVGRHVLRRRQVDVAAFDVTRRAGVGLRRQAARRSRGAIRSIVSSIGAGPTLQLTPMTSAPRLRSSSGANCSGGVPSRRVAVLLGRHLRDDRQIADSARTAAIAAPSSFTSRNVSRMNRSTPPSASAAACSRKRASASSTPSPAPGLDADAERSDRAGHVRRRRARAWRAMRAPGGVDLAELVAPGRRSAA